MISKRLGGGADNKAECLILSPSRSPAIPARQNGPCLGYLSVELAGPGHWLCYQNVTGVSARKNNAAEGTVAPR